MTTQPQVQRVAAYALITRLRADVGEVEILLSRLARRISATELWTLPGGGVEHGEDPAASVVREVHEETGLEARVGKVRQVQSAHWPDTWRGGRRVDAHALRLVFTATVPPDSPEPHVVEVDGSTQDAAWHRLADVRNGTVPVAEAVRHALEVFAPRRLQRLAAYGLVRSRDGQAVLLTRISAKGHHAGAWTLPGGGVEHGEAPAHALVRELQEECGISPTVGDLLGVHDVHFTGTAPDGTLEDFHGVHLVFAATVPADAEPRVVATDDTTDAVAWVPLTEVASGALPVLEVVTAALTMDSR